MLLLNSSAHYPTSLKPWLLATSRKLLEMKFNFQQQPLIYETLLIGVILDVLGDSFVLEPENLRSPS